MLGDFILFLDLCKKYKRATGYDSYIILKKTNKTFVDMAAGYPFVKVISLNSIFGLTSLIKLLTYSVLVRCIYFIKIDSFAPNAKVKITLAIIKYFTMSVIYTRFLSAEGLVPNLNFLEINNNFINYITKKNLVFESSLSYIKELDDKFLNEYNIKENEYICLVLGSSNTRRMIPPKDWVNIISFLNENNPNKKLVILGSGLSIELESLKEISDILKFEHINLMGKISIQKVINILDYSYCVISPNTGLTLISYMLKNTKTIIFSENLGGYLFYNLQSENCRFTENPILCLCNKTLHTNKYCCFLGINIFEEFKKSFKELGL